MISNQVGGDGDILGLYPRGLAPNPFAFNAWFGWAKYGVSIRDVSF